MRTREVRNTLMIFLQIVAESLRAEVVLIQISKIASGSASNL